MTAASIMAGLMIAASAAIHLLHLFSPPEPRKGARFGLTTRKEK